MKLKEKQGIEYKDPCKKGCLTHRYHCGDCNRALSYSPANYCSRPADIPNPCPKCNAQFYQACSPLQEPREKKKEEDCHCHGECCIIANKVFPEVCLHKDCATCSPPQPEKTDYQKRIEEMATWELQVSMILEMFFGDGTGRATLDMVNCRRELLSLLQEVRSEEQVNRAKQITHAFNEGFRSRDSELPRSYKKGFKEGVEAQEKRIEEIIKSLEWKQPTKYHEDKEEAKICKVLEHPCKARQYEFRDLKNHYNYALKDVLSKLKEV